MSALYVDTSALIKWYVAEAHSEDFEAFIRDYPGAWISRLAVVELRCALARRRRAGGLDANMERAAYQTFEGDVRLGFITVLAVQDQHFIHALELIERLQRIPLRTLDALHLAVALGQGVTLLATADRIQAEAAKKLGLKTQLFC
jgi:predicted nucleic acid-binding protein